MESELIAAGLGPVAGVDEAGRGACCGPISIAACILPAELENTGLDRLTDSKKLTERTRERLYDVIRDVAVAYSIIHISAEDIDRFGIQHANVSGMRRAVAALEVQPGYVLTDAVKVPGLPMPHLPVVKGDQMAKCISAASVLAKVSRDRVLRTLDEEFPGYGLASHKGYGTKAHMDAVSLHGGTPYHRYSYKNVAAAHRQWLEGKDRG
ncbi:ribonuclease HII [Corynebacterium macclintockiae]|uniref:Ribonuclease HII n=1 Tax=Corynebacterium macclintockiae TaxID=2913501 RepID=A0A9X3RQS1_9CORY|nr:MULTISPECIES: ribonuclease HII [Corynebacterium]MBC6795612.1 ribonuclease HII [Corynebacterium sp. LK28]MCZ9304297.1 ribonuclease HII [Corynebacterium macclintockiae]